MLRSLNGLFHVSVQQPKLLKLATVRNNPMTLREVK